MKTIAVEDVRIAGGALGRFEARIAEGRLVLEHEGTTIAVDDAPARATARALFAPYARVQIDCDPDLARAPRLQLELLAGFARGAGVVVDPLPVTAPLTPEEEEQLADAIVFGEAPNDDGPPGEDEEADATPEAATAGDPGFVVVALDQPILGEESGDLYACVAAGRLLVMPLDVRRDAAVPAAWDVTDLDAGTIARELFARIGRVRLATSSSIDFPEEDGWREAWPPVEKLEEALAAAADLGVDLPGRGGEDGAADDVDAG